jgi:hypothetical protein
MYGSVFPILAYWQPDCVSCMFFADNSETLGHSYLYGRAASKSLIVGVVVGGVASVVSLGHLAVSIFVTSLQSLRIWGLISLAMSLISCEHSACFCVVVLCRPPLLFSVVGFAAVVFLIAFIFATLIETPLQSLLDVYLSLHDDVTTTPYMTVGTSHFCAAIGYAHLLACTAMSGCYFHAGSRCRWVFPLVSASLYAATLKMLANPLPREEGTSLLHGR